MKKLDKETILLFHEEIIEKYGGTHGVRDENLLDSALNAPSQGFGGLEFFPTVIEKAARLCFGLVKNHPFHDGNKRIGTVAMLSMLDLNHITLNATNRELADVVLALAAGEIDDTDLLQWVQDHT
ncbi:MAG: type II toxin-antitoxin system death-on-curing family toxin [Selenomonadaceae bacterium]|nr:type II toxin-antitoxin system death-on-curing family toxin [Selenomonadaceae bacterium]